MLLEQTITGLRSRGYQPATDGLWRKAIEFETSPRRVVLVRDASGDLVRVERTAPAPLFVPSARSTETSP